VCAHVEKARSLTGYLEFEIFRSVLADLTCRKIPNMVHESKMRPAMVLFERQEFSRARVYFGRLSSASRLELIFAVHAVNVIRMDPDTDLIRMIVPAAPNLVSMFCATWLTFTRALVSAQEWSLRDISTLYPDVTAAPVFAAPIRVFGRLVLGQKNLRLPEGFDVRLPGVAVL
jgi:hypothetical protein